MESVMSRRAQIGLFLGLTVLGLGLSLLIGAWFLKVVVPSPVRAPFPGAILETITVHPTATGSLVVTRHYRVLAPFRKAVEWYRGKDSLMPLPAVMGPHCFHQNFRRSLTLMPGVIRGGVTEKVTVCPTTRGVTVTSITMTHFQVLVP